MSKLIYAGFSRLFKSRIFWLCLVVALLFSTIDAWNEYRQFAALGGELDTCAEETLFQTVPYMIFLCAALIGLYVGTEYSDGGLRNKIVVGHKRASVYLSNLIVTAIASGVILLAALGAAAAVAIPTLGLRSDPLQVLYICVCSLFASMALSAFLTLIAMLAGNRATGAVLCFALALALLIGGSMLEGRLEEPELVDNYISLNEYGQPLEVEQQPNPLYIGGAKRTVLQLICDALPTGQAAQISNLDILDTERPERFIPLSVMFAALCTLGGLAVFKRKDLR